MEFGKCPDHIPIFTLTQEEVDSLISGPKNGDDKISEEEWEIANKWAIEDGLFSKVVNKEWTSIAMSNSDWRKIQKLIESQPIGEFYKIYSIIVSNLPGENT